MHSAEQVAAPEEPSSPPKRSDGSETILVVEDDNDVRSHTTEILHELGYDTLEAGTGHAAMQLLQAHPEISLLFTDVVLVGGMNGRQLADRAQGYRKDIKVLFTTGYARNAIVHGGRLDAGVQLITKPSTYDALASKIRSILDARSQLTRILLVEDDFLIQMVGLEYLEELGFKGEAAGSATEAMNKLKLLNADFGAAVIDVGLPDRKGDILVAEVRAIYPCLPIVIASGYAEDALRAQFKGDASVVFLAKPYVAEQLGTALASLNVTNNR